MRIKRVVRIMVSGTMATQNSTVVVEYTHSFYTHSLYPNISFTMSERKKAKREETTTVVTVVDNSIKEEQWYPLMSDTSVMNALVEKMGFDTSLYKFTDIFSIEPCEIKKITQPVAAVMMFIPLTQVQKQYNEHEQHTPTYGTALTMRAGQLHYSMRS